MKRHGSVMLETVLVLPIFVILVFVLFQSTFVWTARQMTVYAAYCAARAALVYHPDDYATDGGVAKRAACEVLGWISFSHKGSAPVSIPVQTGSYSLPASEGIAEQVSVSVKENVSDLPTVTAAVSFKYPLIVPLGGLMYVFDAVENGRVDVGTEDGGWHYMRIVESCTLPRPYSNRTFPVMPIEDREALSLK